MKIVLSLVLFFTSLLAFAEHDGIYCRSRLELKAFGLARLINPVSEKETMMCKPDGLVCGSLSECCSRTCDNGVCGDGHLLL